jgi:uncharacterized RDD family membrane protein YckC
MEQSVDTQTMPTSQVQSNQSTVQYAGFWQRVLASVVDGIIISLVANAIALIITSGSNSSTTYAVQTFQFLIGWVYFAMMESSVRQATLGKEIMGLTVTNYEGGRLSFAQATGRYFAKIISSLTLFVGFLMIAWTEKKQGLHDIIAKTYVVKKG